MLIQNALRPRPFGNRIPSSKGTNIMTTVFLDLEETVIDDWNSANILVERCEQIRKILDHIQPDKVGVLSWAIWNDRDKDHFINTCVKSRIEDHIGREIDPELVWTMTDMRAQVLKTTGRSFSQDDLLDIFGKEECLNVLFRKHFFKTDVVLIDDTVAHQLVTEFQGLRLVYLNAKKLG